jgi:geranylgeranyl pyrophosphate synthase
MDDYTAITGRLAQLPALREREEARAMVRHFAARQPRDWLLPLRACRAVGGREESALPVAAAIAGLHLSILLVDDMLDEDPRGEYRRTGCGAAANLALLFQAAATEAVLTGSLPPNVKLAVLGSLSRMMATLSYGQHLDGLNPGDEAGYWQVVETKSAPFFAAALESGALAGGATPQVVAGPLQAVAGLERLGRLYGAMIQIHDDVKDCLAQPAGPDWLLGRASLPILFAQTVTHPWQEQFKRLRPAVSDPAALTEAQTILIRCGSVSYCVSCLLERYREARSLLQDLPLPYPGGLHDLLQRVIAPVQQLFARVSTTDLLGEKTMMNGMTPSLPSPNLPIPAALTFGKTAWPFEVGD